MHISDSLSIRLMTGTETCREHQCRDKSAEGNCLCAMAANRIEALLMEVALANAKIASLANPNVVRLDAERERRLADERRPGEPWPE
jgi:hypothetical protein